MFELYACNTVRCYIIVDVLAV